MRRTIAQPSQRARTDLSRPLVLRSSRQRRPHSGHHRRRHPGTRARSIVFHADSEGPRVTPVEPEVRGSPTGIWWLALGYFGSYVWFSALVTALTHGWLPAPLGSAWGFGFLR